MSRKRAGWIAFWASSALAIVGITAEAAHGRNVLIDSEALGELAFVAFGLVGAIALSRQPGNALGRIYCAAGVISALSYTSNEWATFAYGVAHRPPLALLAAWIQNWIWFAPIGLVFTFGLLLFPNGRAPSPKWRWVGWVSGIGVTALTLGLMLHKGSVDGHPHVLNPTGLIHGETVFLTSFLVIVVGAVASLVSLAVRLHRSRGIERQQVKWLVYGAGLALSVLLTAQFVPIKLSNKAEDYMFGAMLLLIPLCCGIAMGRYRLYDIDVVINRTLVYALSTALLATAYAGLVLLFSVVSPLAKDSPAVVAISTLMVAALFRPARARIQAFIDRRFYRSRYDATRTLEQFSTRLRDELDMNALSDALVETAGETVKPRVASLWLREDEPPRGV